MKLVILNSLVLVGLLLLDNAAGDRTSQLIYSDVKSIAGCFRRFNATHQIGCNSAARSGNVGVVHYIEATDDIDWLVDKGPHKPYVALMTYKTFNRKNVDRLRNSGKINGILVTFTNDTSEVPDNFSPDKPCPNDQYGIYKDDPQYAHCRNVTWNKEANSLLFEDFDFPIMALKNATEVYDGLIKSCYEKFNKPANGEAKSFPLCAAEVRIAMDGAVDTPTCMRRTAIRNSMNPQRYCDPLGSWSVYGFVHPVRNAKPIEKDLIVASTRMDSFSMFENEYPSADSSVSGIVALLAAAEALGKVKGKIDPDKHKPIMFMFPNGEAFDYMGSQRIVYEMEKDRFPWNYAPPKDNTVDDLPQLLYPSNISYFLEVAQVGLKEEDKLWLHTDPISMKDETTEKAVEELIGMLKSQTEVAYDEPPSVQPLPPASLQSFLQNTNVPGVVIADHKSSFTNKYYNSRFDTAESINHIYPDVNMTKMEKYNYVTEAAKHLAKVAVTIAKTLYFASTDNSTDEIVVNETSVTNLLYCFLISPQCDILNETMIEADFKATASEPFSYYVGVLQGNSYASPFIAIRSLLGYYLRNEVADGKNKTACDEARSNLYDYVWINGPVNETSPDQSRIHRCIEVTSNLTLAESPAFDIKDYNWTSNKYGAWSESSWASTESINLRFFLVPSQSYEIAILCGGVGVLVPSFVLVYLISSRAKKIFSVE